MPDPAALTQHAGALSHLAGQYGTLATRVDALLRQVGSAGWQGEAADQFLAVSTQGARHLAALQSPLDEISGATRSFAEGCATATDLRARAAEMEQVARAEAAEAYSRLAVIYPGAMVVHDPAVAAARAAAESAIAARLEERLAEAAHLDGEAAIREHDTMAAYRARTAQASDAMRGLAQQVFGVVNDLLNGLSVASIGLTTRAFARAARLPGELDQLERESIDEYGAELERQVAAGALDPEEAVARLSARIDHFESARVLFGAQQNEETLNGGVDVFGSAADAVGHVLGGVAVLGDVLGVVDPPQQKGPWSVADRVASGVNGLGVVGLSAAPLLGLDATTGWIPVAGQAIVLATGVYLVGASLYASCRPFRRMLNDVGRGVEDAADVVASAGTHVASELADGVCDFVGHTDTLISGIESLF